jgi:hypothetical protein
VVILWPPSGLHLHGSACCRSWTATKAATFAVTSTTASIPKVGRSAPNWLGHRPLRRVLRFARPSAQQLTQSRNTMRSQTPNGTNVDVSGDDEFSAPTG